MAKYQKHEKNGLTLRSKFELRIANYLWDQGIDFTYESESFDYSVKVPGTFCENCGQSPSRKKGTYTPDFFFPNGVIVEAKGLFTPADRKKLAAMKEQHPHLDIRVLLQYDNWLTKAKKKRYSDWCKSKDIPCSAQLSDLMTWAHSGQSSGGG